MNIQIFGTNKCFDTKKAMRYFSERGVKYQYINLREKEISKREFQSIKQGVGQLEDLIDQKCKDKDLLALINYIAEEDREEKILENQQVLKTPIVRNKLLVTVGFCPDVWKGWNE